MYFLHDKINYSKENYCITSSNKSVYYLSFYDYYVHDKQSSH